jgi:hypothetical protein
MAFLLILAVLTALVVVPRVIGRLSGSAVRTLMEQARSTSTERRRIRPTFVTRLSPADGVAALLHRARGHFIGVAMPAPETVEIQVARSSTVTAAFSVTGDGFTKVRLEPCGDQLDDATTASVHGVVLAALRAYDPQARMVLR